MRARRQSIPPATSWSGGWPMPARHGAAPAVRKAKSRKRKAPPGLRKTLMRRTRRGWAYSPLGFLRRIVVSIYENQVMFLASALAFDALLATLPFCVLVLAALGYILHSMGGTL